MRRELGCAEVAFDLAARVDVAKSIAWARRCRHDPHEDAVAHDMQKVEDALARSWRQRRENSLGCRKVACPLFELEHLGAVRAIQSIDKSAAVAAKHASITAAPHVLVKDAVVSSLHLGIRAVVTGAREHVVGLVAPVVIVLKAAGCPPAALLNRLVGKHLLGRLLGSLRAPIVERKVEVLCADGRKLLLQLLVELGNVLLHTLLVTDEMPRVHRAEPVLE